MLANDQAGEQLWQSEIMPGELVTIIWKAKCSQKESGPHHLPWRFAGQHNKSNTLPNLASTRRTQRHEKEGSRQSRISTFFKIPPSFSWETKDVRETKDVLSVVKRDFEFFRAMLFTKPVDCIQFDCATGCGMRAITQEPCLS